MFIPNSFACIKVSNSAGDFQGTNVGKGRKSQFSKAVLMSWSPAPGNLQCSSISLVVICALQWISFGSVKRCSCIIRAPTTRSRTWRLFSDDLMFDAQEWPQRGGVRIHIPSPDDYNIHKGIRALPFWNVTISFKNPYSLSFSADIGDQIRQRRLSMGLM